MNRYPALLLGLSLSSFTLLHSMPARADEAPSAPVAEAAPSAATGACAEVEVNGVRSQSFACLTEKLKPRAPAVQSGQQPAPMGSEQIINQPANQLGVFNRAALSNRMGNTLSTSVYPQRPPASAR
ncbi:MAG: hypothetical protein GAK35_01628 [Herbaspirillum frisingense]|uniref:Uncharacterized protein n=1 Tax=Herbaspirillum frisingense TaxID=92645 RepID=A0A7V8JUL4_9BURK|nr:MAG: hypothetical protein GAK35_01628 [Herbaspirillum frisingense]